MLEILKIWQLWVALILGPFLFVFVWYRFAPNFKLHLIAKWSGENNRFLILSCTVKNEAAIRVVNPEITLRMNLFDSAYPNVIGPRIAHNFTDSSSKSAYKNIGPTRINSLNSRFYPKEENSWEMLYEIEDNVVAVQSSLRVGVRLNWIGRLITRKKKSWAQSVSLIAVRPNI